MLIAFFAISNLNAQVQYSHMPLKDAITQAKKENKKVFVMVCTTWCGPCKEVAKFVLPDIELGEFMNKNFVFVKYEVDKEDPNDIKKNYLIGSYPTFIILDGDGNEYSRFRGVGSKVPDFRKAVENALVYKNSWTYHAEMIEKDPNHLLVYVRALQASGRMYEADKLMNDNLSKRSNKVNFNEENLEYYFRDLKMNKFSNKTADYVVIKSMIDNEKQIMSDIGKKRYNEIMARFADEVVFNPDVHYYIKKEKDFDSMLMQGKLNKALQTDFYKQLVSQRDNIVLGNYSEVLNNSVKFVIKLDSDKKLKYADLFTKLTNFTKDMSKLDLSKERLEFYKKLKAADKKDSNIYDRNILKFESFVERASSNNK